MGFYTILAQCDRPFGVLLFDEKCLRTYKPIFSHVVVFSFAYLVNDGFMQIFFYQDFSLLGQQNIVHHFVSFVCYFCALKGGHSMPMLTHVAMTCELSQIFLNIRNVIGKESTGLFPLINNLVFFFTYTLFRVILFPWLILAGYQSGKLYDLWNTNQPLEATSGDHQIIKRTSLFHQICWVTLLFFFVIVYILNLFWYSLIVRGVLKICKGDSSGRRAPPSRNTSQIHPDTNG